MSDIIENYLREGYTGEGREVLRFPEVVLLVDFFREITDPESLHIKNDYLYGKMKGKDEEHDILRDVRLEKKRYGIKLSAGIKGELGGFYEVFSIYAGEYPKMLPTRSGGVEYENTIIINTKGDLSLKRKRDREILELVAGLYEEAKKLELGKETILDERYAKAPPTP